MPTGDKYVFLHISRDLACSKLHPAVLYALGSTGWGQLDFLVLSRASSIYNSNRLDRIGSYQVEDIRRKSD